jgi:thioredoxin 1
MDGLLPPLIGAAIGTGLGALAGLLVRSSDKAWAFIRSPVRGAIFGLVFGAVFGVYFGAPSGWTKDNVPVLTAETFDKTIGGDVPVIVDFSRDDCPACRQLAPRIEQLAEEYKGRVLVARVDVGHDPALANRFAIRVVPTLVYFVGGKPTGIMTEGMIGYRRLRNRADELIVEHAAAAKAAAPGPAVADQPPTEEHPAGTTPQ